MIKFTNHSLLSIILLAIGITYSCQTVHNETTDSKLPNIILLMGDDQGWDEVGYNGHPYLQTPVLDEMAATGLRMDRFYSASPVWQQSVLESLMGNDY
ncbi:sulfatase-like hydrolase/transferase [Aquiflexum sp.]|uniref:sulfatase-like hydrolase/transferase n=1 Tax=Aquiflexum sp. TaxID=1872584 RepID=UPI0035934097